MVSKRTALEISAICGLFILLALWGIVWDITSGLLTSGIDGIMLLLVCAMMTGIFLLIMLADLNRAGIIPTPGFLKAAPKPALAPAAAKPAAAPKPSVPAAAPKPAPLGVAAPAAPKPAAPVSAPALAKPGATTTPAGTTAAEPPVPEK